MSTQEMLEKDIAPIEDVQIEVDIVDEDVEVNVISDFKDLLNNLDESQCCNTKKCNKGSIQLTVREYIGMFKRGEVEIPDFQRLEVWNEDKVMELYDSIERGYPFGDILICDISGKKVIADGLQRTYALTKLAYDGLLTTQQECVVLNTEIRLEIAYVATMADAKELFRRRNSGIILAAVVKERSRLPEELNRLVVSISGRRFFRKSKTCATFNKGQHNDLIAMNCLIAASGLAQGENKPKGLCKVIDENKSIITSHYSEAVFLAERLESIYNDLSDEITKRSLNANYISSLLYVMANHPDITDYQIVTMTEAIFKEARAAKWYSSTTSTGAADAGNCRKRQELLIDFLSKCADSVKPVDIEGFKVWVENHGEFVHDSTGETEIPFALFEREDRVSLYSAIINKDVKTLDKVVRFVFDRDMKQSA